MKKILLTTVALSFISSTAFAGGYGNLGVAEPEVIQPATKTLMGCELKRMTNSNAWTLVDPTCAPLAAPQPDSSNETQKDEECKDEGVPS